MNKEKINSKWNELEAIWDKIASYIGDDYEMITPPFGRTVHGDRYLIKKGTSDQVTYFGKPEYSFRISDHWHWETKERAPGVVQCPCHSLKKAKVSEKPYYLIGIQVYYDGAYHYLAGDIFRDHKRVFSIPSDGELYEKLYNFTSKI